MIPLKERAEEAWIAYKTLCPHFPASAKILCEDCFKACVRAACTGAIRDSLSQSDSMRIKNDVEYGKRLLDFATKMALEYIPKLGIPPEHQESALKAYVAGFFAGNGAQAGEAKASIEFN